MMKKIDAERLLFLNDKQYTDTELRNHAHSYGSEANAQVSSPTDNVQDNRNDFRHEQIRG
jgi:hypothetical protein